MHFRNTLLACAALALGSASAASAQPQQQPLVQPGNLSYVGQFTLPGTDGTGRGTAEGAFIYGGAASGIGPDGQSLYYGCHDWGSRLARVTIPAIGGRASVVEPCAPVSNLDAINPGDTNSKKLGGSLWWNGRLLVTGYAYYDGNKTASSSHFTGPNVASLNGPYRVGSLPPGFVAGYMGVIPQEWRGLLGGPALTGQCCLAIISRTSYGPSVSVFNPDDVGTQAVAPVTPLVGYDEAHQAFPPWNVPNKYFTGVTRIGGVAFPAGTRSVLFIGRQGTTFCYGSGTPNASLAGQPDGQGNVYCYDPVHQTKGSHGYPYVHQIWAYDANDLLAVKQGQKMPWDVLPYAVWPLSEMDSAGTATMQSATYDQATRRWYVMTENQGAAPVVHVYELNNAAVQPPKPGPLNFAAQTSASGVTLVWQPPTSGGVTGYSLSAGRSPGASDIGSVTLAGHARSFQIPAHVTGLVYFRLLALYADGSSGAAPEINVNIGGSQLPAAPTNVRAAVNGNTLTLTWDPPDSSVTTVVADVGYSSGVYDRVTDVALGKFAPYVGTVQTGTYYVRLRAISPAGSSGPSNEVKLVMGSGGNGGGAPPPPVGLRATQLPDGRVTLTWQRDDNGADTSGYLLEVGSQPGAVDIGNTPLATPGFTSGGPVLPGVYFIRVRAVNAAGASAPGREVRFQVY